MKSNAIFDPTGTYRYELSRIWDEKYQLAVFIMLNPSTANATDDDPTIRRCMAFAQAWEYGGLKVVNLFAMVSSDPMPLQNNPFAIDEGNGENDDYILRAVEGAGIVIAAWGAFREAKERAKQVLAMIREHCDRNIYCLGITKDGSPKHPLYIDSRQLPVLYVSGRLG